MDAIRGRKSISTNQYICFYSFAARAWKQYCVLFREHCKGKLHTEQNNELTFDH